jgi:hypothetical protein
MSVIAYLKQQCGWSRGVREVLAKSAETVNREFRKSNNTVN